MEIPALRRQLVSTEGNLITSIDTTDINCKIKYDVDFLFEQLSDLVNEQYRPWYCKHFYRLGRDNVLRLAAISRADAKKDKRRYFSTMLKRAGPTF